MQRVLATLAAVVAMAAHAVAQTAPNVTVEQCAAFNSNCGDCIKQAGCIYCTPTVTASGSCVPLAQDSLCAKLPAGIPSSTCTVAGVAMQWWFWVAIGVGVILLLSFLLCCCCWCRKRSARKRRAFIAKQEAQAALQAETRAQDSAARKEASAARAEALRKKYGMLKDSTDTMGDAEVLQGEKSIAQV